MTALYCRGVATVSIPSPSVTCAAVWRSSCTRPPRRPRPRARPRSASHATSRPLVARHCAPCHRDDGDAPVQPDHRRRRPRSRRDDCRGRRQPLHAAVEAGAGLRRVPRRAPPARRRRGPDSRHGPVPGPRSTSPPARRSPAPTGRERQAASGRGRAVASVPPARRRARTSSATSSCRSRSAAPRYVRGVEFRPRGRAVHHANIRVDPTPSLAPARRGRPRGRLRGLDSALGGLSGWPLPRLDAGTDWAGAVGGSRLAARRAARTWSCSCTCGRPATPKTSRRRSGSTSPIGRRSRRSVMLRLGRSAGDSCGRARPPRRGRVRASGRRRPARRAAACALPRARGQRPGRHCRTGRGGALLRIADWDARWQDRYQYRAPVRLPAGTRIAHDLRLRQLGGQSPQSRSAAGSRPSGVGGRSDEMGDVWFQMVAATEADRPRLHRRAPGSEDAREDALGCELLLRREPDHVALRERHGADLHGPRPSGRGPHPLRGRDAGPARLRRRPGSTRGSRSKRWPHGEAAESRYTEALRAPARLFGRAQQPRRAVDARRPHRAPHARSWRRR